MIANTHTHTHTHTDGIRALICMQYIRRGVKVLRRPSEHVKWNGHPVVKLLLNVRLTNNNRTEEGVTLQLNIEVTRRKKIIRQRLELI